MHASERSEGPPRSRPLSRRARRRSRGRRGAPAAASMTKNPRTLQEDQPLREAERLVRIHRVDEIPIVDAEGHPVGLLDVQDLITLKIVRDPT